MTEGKVGAGDPKPARDERARQAATDAGYSYQSTRELSDP